MIHDAEKNAEQDKILKEKLEAKQSLDQYLYTMRATINDRDKLADKLEGDDKATIKDALDEGDQWIRSNEETASKEDFERQLKDIQRVCDPIIGKLYQKYGGQQ
jgi:heat shock protein 5